MSIRTATIATILVSSLLAGCFNLSPTEATTRYYVLGADARGVEPSAAAGSGSGTIGLTKLALSPYLENVRIVARHGAHQVTFAEFDRWGETLDRGINRALASHLERLLPVRQVEAAPWTAGTRPDVVISVRVERFEGVTEGVDVRGGQGAVHLLATWELFDGETRERVASGTTDYRESGWRVGDYGQLVAMLDEAVLELARDIALATPQI